MSDAPVVRTGNGGVDLRPDPVAPAAGGGAEPKAALIAAIAETIRRRGLTQTEAARLCRTDQPTLSKVLRGRLERVSIDKLAAWLTALGRTVEIRVLPEIGEAAGAHGEGGPAADVPRRSEDLLRLYRLLLDSMTEGVSLSTEDGTIVYTNPAEDRMFGYAPGELIGRHVTVQNAYPPEENARVVAEVMAELRAKGVWRGDWLNRKKDGTPFYTSSRITAVELDGRRHWLCVQEDITERRRAEAEVAAALRRTTEILESIGDAFYALDRDWRFTYANRRALELWGRRAEEVLGRRFLDAFPEAAGSESYAAHLRAAEERRAVHVETVSPVLDRWLSVSIYPSAKGGLSIYFRDVTDRKLAEEALRRSEEKLRMAFQAARLGAWERDLRTGELEASATCKANLGLPPDAPLTFEMLQAMRHPDDRERVGEAIRRAIAERTDYDVESRVVWPDGSVHWLIARGHALYDQAGGRPVRMVGVTLDITERKRMEEALRESEARFRALADSAPVLIWMSGADKAGVYFNRPWLDFTGRPLERELGDGWIEAVHPEDRPALEACGEAFAARRPFRTEFRLRRHDGEWRWMLDTGVPRFGPDGAFAGYIGSCVDITERRQAEERRTLLLNELNHRVKNTLATVQSLAAQTLRGAPSPEAFRAAFEARLVALSNTHDLLTRDSWVGARLRDILEAEMAPYADDGGGAGETSPSPRIVLRGAAVRLAPKAALTLGMAFHELATNAAKYGALSAPTGRVEVSWDVRAMDGPRRLLRLDWREAGGPPVEAPRRRGFGSRLVERSIANELEGAVRLDFEPGGVRCTMEVPLGPGGDAGW